MLYQNGKTCAFCFKVPSPKPLLRTPSKTLLRTLPSSRARCKTPCQEPSTNLLGSRLENLLRTLLRVACNRLMVPRFFSPVIALRKQSLSHRWEQHVKRFRPAKIRHRIVLQQKGFSSTPGGANCEPSKLTQTLVANNRCVSAGTDSASSRRQLD